MKKLIKVLSQEKANELIDLGFNYMLDSVNGKPVHVFFICDELMKHVNTNFTAHDYFLDSGLRF